MSEVAFDAEDKENVPLEKNNQLRDPTAHVDKLAQPKRGKFNQILHEASSQLREQWDEQYAADRQLDEAVVLVEEWVMEQKDYELAKQLADAFEKEAKADTELATIKGEAAAINAAVEERRRLKTEEKAKQDQEKADAEFAKLLIEEEAKYSQKYFEDDEKLAQKIAETVTPVKAIPAEVKEKETPASPQLHSIEHKEEEFKADDKTYNNDNDHEIHRFRQYLQDAEYSKKIAAKEVRALFQHKKRVAMEASFEKSARDEVSIAKLWEDAEAEVEDVHGAVALTLLLPNIQRLTVTLQRNGKTLCIEAARLVLNKGVEKTAINSSFMAEFQLEGGDLRIKPQDVTHVYSSETGLLHVYIEDVNLNFCRQDDKASDSKSILGSNFIRAMKNGFSRVFAKK